jgi:hypothetical protein
MPNHVDCDLRINGKRADIEEFLTFAKTDKKLIDENKFIPYPEVFTKKDAEAREARAAGNYDIKDGYNSGGYEWCRDHWGTKWGMYDHSDVKLMARSAKVSFQTAWSPPKPIVKKMGEMFPKLKFTLRYYECGSQFKGVLIVKDGQVEVDESSKYFGNRGG